MCRETDRFLYVEDIVIRDSEYLLQQQYLIGIEVALSDTDFCEVLPVSAFESLNMVLRLLKKEYR